MIPPAATDRRTVRVRLYAAAKERAGADTVDVRIACDATIGDLATALAAAVPALHPLSRHLLFAVGTDYVSKDSKVPADGEVVAFPPVSGG